MNRASPRDVHHFAALLGYGACAVNPYLAHAAIGELVEDGLLDKDYYAAVADYDNAVLQGIVKIASKMGVSTIQSYQGSQLFEALGISDDVIEDYFTGTVSRVGGITLEDIAAQTDAQHSRAFGPAGPAVRSLSELHRPPQAAQRRRNAPLQTRRRFTSCRRPRARGSYDLFREYTKLADAEKTGYLRSLMDFRFPDQGVPIDEVESVDSIVRRFKTGAMSYGSISQEAHEALAIAMNRLHGKSNSGEGGESDERLASAGTADDRSSAIKQVASGPLRRHKPLPREREGNPDQDGAGREARRGRPSAREKSVSLDREDAPLHARREPHLPAAAPRHLLHRGPGSAHL